LTAILGISAFYHDSAACLVRDGVIVAAAQEERFTRKKGDESFPRTAAAYCLREGAIAPRDLVAVAFYEKPLLRFDRLIETYLAIAPRGIRSFGHAARLWSGQRLTIDRQIREGLGGYEGQILYCEHHESHAASAFYPSPFDEAAILTIDGVGEWATATIGRGNGNAIAIDRELHFPDSLGLLYSAFTYHAGFRVNSGEYKLMGLAPYGRPVYVQAIHDHLIPELREDGSFRLDQCYFDYIGGLTMTNARFAEVFGGPPRAPESLLTQREMDLARSVQDVCEEIMRRMARTAVEATGTRALCLAGGVALNAVANGKLLRERIADRIWVQPAAGDAGGALGAALLAWHRWNGAGRSADGISDQMQGALLGPAFDEKQIQQSLDEIGGRYERHDRGVLVGRVAEALAAGQVVGWFDGRMEFGPRALGARSILADPRDPRMQATLNLKIKFREGFRPFAPSVLAEDAAEYFEMDAESPYMLFVSPVQPRRRLENAEGKWGIDQLNEPRSDIPAVTHLDYSARVQTVTRGRSPGLREVLEAFRDRTGCPVLVNTSFNVRGEPIVCTPADAYRCFMRTRIDLLAMPPFLLHRAQQPLTATDQWNAPLQLD
jgi:carbamoyltransferase